MHLTDLIYYGIALLVAITVHEAAHAWTAYKLGDHTAKYEGRVSLNPLAHLDPIGTLMIFIAHFGWGKPVHYNPHYLKNPKQGAALIAIAGPIANFLTALLFAIPLQYVPFEILGNFGHFLFNVISIILYLNIGLLVFNLLPIGPLDGSKIIGIFIPEEYENEYQAYLQIGPFLLIGLILLENFGIGLLGNVLLPLIDTIYSLIFLIT